MENIETLLAAVAQTQGFDDDEPVASSGSAPKLGNSEPSPEIRRHVGGSPVVGDHRKASGTAGLSAVVNPAPVTTVAAGVQVVETVVKRKRGRPPKGQMVAKPPPPKRKKQEEEEDDDEEDGEDVCFICFDGGSLVLCDRKGCPKAYHPSCIKRDEAFFKSKAKWNCGWHICSVCRKTSYYMCYTCPYSLCKGCTKDEDYVRVRGNKGFCTTCMKTIMLIENKDQASNDSAVQVDFDDITSWEYLFKTYWVTLKEQLSLTLKDLTHAKRPWKGVVPVVCKPQLSNVGHTVVNGNVSIPTKTSEHLEMSKLQEAPNDRLTTAHSAIDNHVGKLNHNSSEDGQFLSRGGENKNTNKPTIIAEPGTIKQVTVQAGDNPSIEDAAQPDTTDKLHVDHIETHTSDKLPVDHIEIPKLPQSHALVKEDSQKNSVITAGHVGTFESGVEVNGNNFDQSVGLKNRNQDTCKKHEERATQNDLSKYAAIDVHNMNLIYLRRNLMENLIEDKETFQDNVVGSIVRIRISSDDQKPDVYRLVQVVGICKASKPYKIGDKTVDVMLEVLNLGKKEIVSVDAISNQEFVEAECRQLDQYIRCGLLKQYTLDEVQKKAMALQSVRFDDWLEAEILRLYHLLDQASKKGCEEEVSEYVRKIQVMKSPEERQLRISKVPEIHTDTETGPNYNSEDAKSSGNSTKDEHVSPRQSVSPLNEKKSVSPKERGKDEGSIGAQSKLVETIDASGSHDLEKCLNQVNITNSAIAGGHDQGIVRSELETSTATVSVVNSLTDDNIEIEKLWHYRDPNGKIQGPFSMMHLRQWSTTGQFPPEMRIWTNHENFDSLLFTDALNGKFHGASELPHNLSSGSRGIKGNKAINTSNGDIKQADATRCNNSSALSENNSGNKMADESSWPKCWDLFKDKSSNAHDVPGYSLIPPSGPVQMPEATAIVRECDETNHVPKNTEKNSSGPIQNDTTGAYELQNKSTQQCLARQSPEEKLGPLPIGLSLNDIEPESISEPVSKSLPKSIKPEADLDVSILPSPKQWGVPTAEKQQSEYSNVSMQNLGFLELLSPKPRSDNEDQEIRADETKQSGPVNFLVPNVDPSWSSALNMVVGGVRLPDVANEWCGYSAGLIPASSSKPPEITSDNNVVTSEINHFSPPHPVPNMPSWLAMINEPIEFDALGEESVSDLLAEVDAMESQGTMPSPTSAMKFAKELIQDCKDDCFSSIEDFDPGKSDALSSTGEIQLNHPSSIPFKPIGPSLIDALDSFSKSGVHSSGSSAGETNIPVYTGEASSEFHRPAPNTNHEMVGATVGPETSDPGWGNVQGNINLVTVQGNVNLVLGGHAQGMTDLGWGTNQATTWGNPNMNHSPRNGSLPWDAQRKYIGERERFANGREWGYPGVDPGFGRGRPPWGRPPYGGGGGGGGGGSGGRPLPKGQRVCKFYESGRCKKGAFCDYLHP